LSQIAAATSAADTGSAAHVRRVQDALLAFESVRLDVQSVPPDRLDLVDRTRRSLFPWRGQFSPELIQLLLSEYSDRTDVVLDPFVGSGTVLFESARRGLRSIGAEINPAAVIMAKTAELTTISLEGRERLLSRVRTVLTRRGLLQPNMFEPVQPAERVTGSIADRFTQTLREVREDDPAFTVLANVLIGCRSPGSTLDIEAAFARYASITRGLPLTCAGSQVLHSDARAIPVCSGSVGLILTSPPYVNVFNYHQNHRAAAETIGWNLLQVARSEIGANRKHRGNRFLTVIQYALDMAQALREARRVLKPDGRLIIVIGRESTVRGVSVSNSRTICAVATAAADFKLLSRQERKFRTRFGELIYEDILHLAPSGAGVPEASEEYAREIARQMLTDALATTVGEVQSDVAQALSQARLVKPSPLFAASASRVWLTPGLL